MGIFDKVREVPADAKAKGDAEQKALREAQDARARHAQEVREAALRQKAVASPQVVQQVAAPQPDRYEQLKRAAELKDPGVLTADGFEAEKRRILDQN